MPDSKIQPATITKPMQLLGAWLVGLLALDSSFLLAATHMSPGSVEGAALVWAAIFNVPIFLGSLFLLQTKFRPELQEDLYYSTYINQRTNQTVSVTRDEQRLSAIMGRMERIENLLEETEVADKGEQPSLLAKVSFGINKYFEDRDELSKKLFSMGVVRHTWFGGHEPPEARVISISEHLPKQTQDAILVLVEKLGFTRYNLFDNQMEDTEEDVLIGSYGSGNRNITRTVA